MNINRDGQILNGGSKNALAFEFNGVLFSSETAIFFKHSNILWAMLSPDFRHDALAMGIPISEHCILASYFNRWTTNAFSKLELSHISDCEWYFLKI